MTSDQRDQHSDHSNEYLYDLEDSSVEPIPAARPGPSPSRQPPPRKGRSTSFWVALVLGVVCAILVLNVMGTAGNSLAAQQARAGAGKKYMEELIEGHGQDRIVHISIEGAIIGGQQGLFGGGDMVKKVKRMLRQAAKDDRVKAVVLTVNSPGGGITDSDVIANEVRKLDAKKPVVVHMGDICASGGVYVSAPARHIMASPTSLTGSIGVIISHYNMQELYESKLGIKASPITSGKHKDMLSSARQMTAEESGILQNMVDAMHARFVDTVATGRAGKSAVPAEAAAAKAHIAALADGRIYTADQALANGLVDSLGYLEDAVKQAKELAGLSQARFIRYRNQPGLMEALMGAEAELPQVKIPQLALPEFRLEYRLRVSP